MAANTFIQLTDVPPTYVGEGLKFARVLADEDGLFFTNITLNTLEDVETINAYTPQHGQALVYDANASVWRPSSLAIYGAGNGVVLDGTTIAITAPASGGLISNSTGIYIASIANVAGTYGTTTQIPILTVNGRGQITNVTLANVSTVTAEALNADYVGRINGSSGQIIVTGGSGNNANAIVSLVSTGITPGVYGNSTMIPRIAVDTYGRITNIVEVPASGNIDSNANVVASSYSYGVISFPGTLQTSLIADAVEDVLNYVGVDGVRLTSDANADTITIGVDGVALAANLNFGDLHDVNVTGLQHGQTIRYDSTTQTWVPSNSSVGYGYTGSQGSLGFTGSAGAGFTGSAGTLGFTGSAGSLGYTGSAGVDGSIGFTGSAGAGFTGSAGSLGYTGSAGVDGALGFTGSAGAGFTGSAGSLGYTGSAGADGSIGFTGSAGTTGFTGSAGADGSIGFTGSAGAIGYTGSAGTTGFTGSAGAIGYTGSAGTTGFTGSAGADGSIGFTGSAGAGFTGSAGTGGGATVTTSDTPPGSPVDGDLWWDSTQAQLMIYYDDGNSSQWVAATSAMSGYTGSAGANGINGFTGSAGATGATGPVSLASTSTTEAWSSTTEAMTPGGTKNAAPPYVEWGASGDKTLALTDANVDQWCNNGATARVLTIPANSSVAFSLGTKIPVLRLGSGTCTIDAPSGVTLNDVNGGSCTISTRYQGALLAKTGTDAWIISGDVSAVA